MTKTNDLTPQPIAHILYVLQDVNEYKLAYGLLQDWNGEESLTDEETMYIFERIVEAGKVNEAKALIEADQTWTREFQTGFAGFSDNY